MWIIIYKPNCIQLFYTFLGSNTAEYSTMLTQVHWPRWYLHSMPENIFCSYLFSRPISFLYKYTTVKIETCNFSTCTLCRAVVIHYRDHFPPTYTHTYTHTHTYTCLHTHTRTHTYIYIHIYTHIYIYIYIYIYICRQL